MTQKIEISQKSIIFTIFVLVLFWFIYFIKDIIFLIFLALLVSLVINPYVDKLEKKFKIKRGLVAIGIYLFFILVLIILMGVLVRPFVEQFRNFTTSFPNYLVSFQIPKFIVDRITQEISLQVGVLTSQLIRISISVVSNILSLLVIFVFALYFVTLRPKLGEILENFLPQQKVKKIENLILNLEYKVSGWTRAELLLMLVVGFLNYLGLSILGISYAVPLGVLAGLLEIVPNVGPIVAAIPAFIVGFGISPVKGIAVVALAFLIQQIENYLLVPKIMEKSVGVNPLITLFVILVGFRLDGVVGALLSIPVVIILREVAKEFFNFGK